MAGASLSTVSAVLTVLYMDAMADLVRRDVLLPNLLLVENDRNASCVWKAKAAGRNTAAAQAEGHDVADSDFSTHVRKQATLTWAEYYSYVKVSGLSQAVAQASDGNDLLAEELNDALDELAVLLSSETYAGDSTASPTEIGGLAIAVDSADTYAGLAPGTYTWWVSGENTLASASLSLANLRTKLHRPFKDAAGRWPEFVVCPGAQFDAVCALFNDQSRIMVDQVTTRARGSVPLKALGGFRAVEVDGIPYIEDRHCTASTFYALHSQALSYRQVPSPASRLDPSRLQAMVKQLTGVTLNQDDIAQLLVRGSQRLQPQIEALAKTGDHSRLMVKWYGQLRLKDRTMAAKLTLT